MHRGSICGERRKLPVIHLIRSHNLVAPFTAVEAVYKTAVFTAASSAFSIAFVVAIRVAPFAVSFTAIFPRLPAKVEYAPSVSTS